MCAVVHLPRCYSSQLLCPELVQQCSCRAHQEAVDPRGSSEMAGPSCKGENLPPSLPGLGGGVDSLLPGERVICGVPWCALSRGGEVVCWVSVGVSFASRASHHPELHRHLQECHPCHVQGCTVASNT